MPRSSASAADPPAALPSPSMPGLAPNVCGFCKARKRKCDKTLPTCSACQRRKLTCDYDYPINDANVGAGTAFGTSARPNHSSSTFTDTWPFSPPLSQEDEHDHAVPQSLDYPTVLFLDPALLQQGQLDFVQRAAPIPFHLLDLLGSVEEVRGTVAKYLQSVHTWISFMSKTRLQHLCNRLQHSLHTASADTVLLLLAIKLITTPPPVSPRNPRTSLYYTLKHFYLEVEGSCAFSLQVLQAGILLTLYEIAHGIYPAAFLSIAACARFAHAIGINVGRAVASKKALTLLDMEERRRAWWAIVILDRFVSIGCSGRPLATADPGMDEILPTNDVAWDQGVGSSEADSQLHPSPNAHVQIVKPDEYSTVSAPVNMSKFALLCQAARLLGLVLTSLSNAAVEGDDNWMQLGRTLQSMLGAAMEVANPDYDQITFIWSALMALNSPWISPISDHLGSARSHSAHLFLEQLNNTINTNLVESECHFNRDPENMPPWGLFFAYRVCVKHLRTSSNLRSIDVSKALRDSLLRLDTRWNLAGVYLQLLEAQEVMLNS